MNNTTNALNVEQLDNVISDCFDTQVCYFEKAMKLARGGDKAAMQQALSTATTYGNIAVTLIELRRGGISGFEVIRKPVKQPSLLKRIADWFKRLT